MAVKHLRRYLAIVKQVLAERGRVCEACGTPAYHVHHIAAPHLAFVAWVLALAPVGGHDQVISLSEKLQQDSVN